MESRLPLVVAGVPIPGKHNPYLVLVSVEPLLRVEVEVSESQGASRVEFRGPRLGWRFELAVKSFVDTLAARLEQPLHVVLDYSVANLSYPPPASVYAVAGLAIVSSVAEAAGYEMDSGEVFEAANSIDREAGAWYDYVEAMRAAVIRGASIVYRHGEQPVVLGVNASVALELVGEEDIGGEIDDAGEDVVSGLTRAAGMLVVSTVSALRSGGSLKEYWRLLKRVENGLYYIFYGVQPPEEGCKWTPSLQRVYGVCMEGVGLGERVVFML